MAHKDPKKEVDITRQAREDEKSDIKTVVRNEAYYPEEPVQRISSSVRAR